MRSSLKNIDEELPIALFALVVEGVIVGVVVVGAVGFLLGRLVRPLVRPRPAGAHEGGCAGCGPLEQTRKGATRS